MIKSICRFYEKNKWHIYFWAGFLVALGICAAYFLIGKRSYVPIHDQLDGEVLNYIYHAKYLFSGLDVIPEFMNGMHSSAMTPPAPIGVLFYKVFAPFTAYAMMHVFVISVGYIGCFLLVKQITKQPIIPFVTACLFVYLPFYPVYGLSILGQPLLVWALWRLYEKPYRKWKYYFCIFLYAVSSSMALVGYAWIVLVATVVVLLWVSHKETKQMVVAWLVLCGTYLLCNLRLIGSILGIGGASYALHREEMEIYPLSVSELGSYFKKIFLAGINYAEAYNEVIVWLALAILVGYPLVLWRKKEKQICKAYKLLAGCFGLSVLITVAVCAWRSPWIVELRVSLGGFFRYFQADRIGWLLPTCWYFILALCLQILMEEGKRLWGLRYLVSLVLVAYLGNTIYINSSFFHNIRLIVFPNTYHLMNWDDFYAPDVYEQVEAYIGEEKSTYRTLSLGITPAAALYNGFYCLDGYSNMYSLEYKHAFRKIIEKELEKQEESRLYFDNWGNRCYTLNSETGNYVMINKYNSGSFLALELNMKQAYAMGARYLFAAMPVENAEEMGLVLMRETPFSTPESYFEVWLYEIRNVD